MTISATEFSVSSSRRRGWLRRLGLRLTAAFEAHALRMSRRAEIEALEAKSDADLARLGLRREHIAHHVFRDLYYI